MTNLLNDYKLTIKAFRATYNARYDYWALELDDAQIALMGDDARQFERESHRLSQKAKIPIEAARAIIAEPLFP